MSMFISSTLILCVDAGDFFLVFLFWNQTINVIVLQFLCIYANNKEFFSRS